MLGCSFLYPLSPSPGHCTLKPPFNPSISRTRAALNLDPAPAEEGTNPISGAVSGGREGGKDRRRAVRIAWEKLVRWSRMWRYKASSDVLEQTKKVEGLGFRRLHASSLYMEWNLCGRSNFDEQFVVLGGGSFGTAMAAHLAGKKAEMELSMLVRDDQVCRLINETHQNCKYFPDFKLPENVGATTLHQSNGCFTRS